MLSWAEIRETYGRELVNLRFERYNFLNTLFSVSEAVLYLQARPLIREPLSIYRKSGTYVGVLALSLRKPTTLQH